MQKRHVFTAAVAFVFAVSLIVALPMFASAAPWNLSAIDGVGDVGNYNSVAVDGNNKLHISYYDATTRALKYATNSSGRWANTTVDSFGASEGYSSIAVDRNNRVHISYITDGTLKYATNASGAWVTLTIDNSVAVFTNSIAVDSRDRVHIVYDIDDPSSLDDFKYATNASGQWEFESFFSTGFAKSWYTTIAVDSNDKVHLCYGVARSDFMDDFALFYKTNASGTWVDTIVDSSGSFGGRLSIALDANDRVHIGYSDFEFGGLKYATNASGSWGIAMADATNYGGFPSIALDSRNRAHISYNEPSTGNLKYATNASGAWVASIIDAPGDVGSFSSIAVDYSDNVHISYYDLTNGNLKYATNAPGSSIVIDNRDANTSRTGAWQLSTAPNPYGADSFWSNAGFTFTWHFTPPVTGTYSVSMWWTQHETRGTSLPVDITHSGGTARVLINQRVNGGRWNGLATVDLQAGVPYRVTIIAPAYPLTASADAVMFNLVSAAPPSSDTIVDNRDAARTARTGAWQVSGGASPYGPDSLWSNNGATFSWLFTPAQTGSHEVAMWWTTFSNRGASIPVDITHAGGTTRVFINQLTNGGRWNSLGVFNFQAGGNYRVTIVAPASPLTAGADAVKFSRTTAPPPPPPSVTVTAPNGGESWRAGTVQTIRWTYSGTPGSSVKIELLKAGSVNSIISSSVPIGSGGSGSFTWTIPTAQAVGTDYRIRVTSTSTPSATDTSNANFSITAPLATTGITVSAPNGGETWRRGSTQTVRWTYTGTPGAYVTIELLKGGVVSRVIASSITIGSGGTGSYTWWLPATQTAGADYRVRITSRTNASFTDTSNANFTISN